jgi:hypothetical protein
MKAKLEELSYFSQKSLRIYAVEQKRGAKVSTKEMTCWLAEQTLFSKCT